MTNKGAKQTATRTTARKAGAAKPGPGDTAPEATPFHGAFDYLDAWFALLEPPNGGEEAGGRHGRIPSFDERHGHLHFLIARTAKSVAAGADLPFETFVRRHDLDLLDRLVLLALLCAAHDPASEGGLAVARLLQALGAASLDRQLHVLSRLETAGRLRDLGAVHCHPNPNRSHHLFRVAPWLVEPLTTGCGDVAGLPEISVDTTEEMDELRRQAYAVVQALSMDTTQPILIWQAPAEGRPGWDHFALRRRRLTARLEASVRAAKTPVGAEIRRLGLGGEERLAWAFLLHDAQADPVGIPVPTLLRLVGRLPDVAAAAESLLGPASKLGANDCLRFNRPDGPLLSRLVWLSREASGRVVPWQRDAFAVVPGPNGEPVSVTPRSVGFNSRGAATEDHAARARGAA